MMKISVFGLGYVGCVSAVCLAKAGHDVIGVDINEEKVAIINAGRTPIVEPGMETALSNAIKSRQLRATLSCKEAVKSSDVALICVGTPSSANGQIDTSHLIHVAEEIGQELIGRTEPFTIVLRSTMLPGTLKNVFLPALWAGARGELGANVRIAMNPEFMREGSALQDFQTPPLTLVGCDEPETAQLLESLYTKVDAPFIHTSVETAEMMKYACNAYHALKVCFANEIGDACKALGADAQEVMRLFRMDRKLNISGAYLRPGFAFGGSCLPKDIRALVYAVTHADIEVPLLGAILGSNQGQINNAVERVLATGKKRVGIVGLAFKPGTDDLRESPMVELVEALIGKGCQIRILDHNVSLARLMGANRKYIEEEIPHIASLMYSDAEDIIKHAQVIVVGGTGPEAAEVLNDIRPGQVIVDLTFGSVKRLVRNSEKVASRESELTAVV